jgi:hypothetical protein
LGCAANGGELKMLHPLFLLLPFVLAAMRSFAVGIQLRGKPTVSAETEYEFLLVAIFCLTSLVFALHLILRFPDVGAVIAEYYQF